jgi:Rrf2 family protein
MQVTRAGEYGVLGLLYLARLGQGQTAMIEEVSRVERIPRSFLAKIFQSLVRAGLVRSFRGSGGGFALTRRPEDITALEVIEAIEGPIALQRCLLEVPCIHAEGCVLCGLFGEAQHRVREVFGRTSLADLLRRKVPPLPPTDLARRQTPVPEAVAGQPANAL